MSCSLVSFFDQRSATWMLGTCLRKKGWRKQLHSGFFGISPLNSVKTTRINNPKISNHIIGYIQISRGLQKLAKSHSSPQYARNSRIPTHLRVQNEYSIWLKIKAHFTRFYHSIGVLISHQHFFPKFDTSLTALGIKRIYPVILMQFMRAVVAPPKTMRQTNFRWTRVGLTLLTQELRVI